jgi:hypothetical protein
MNVLVQPGKAVVLKNVTAQIRTVKDEIGEFDIEIAYK